MRYLLFCCLTLLFSHASLAQGVEGDWYGLITVNDVDLSVVFHIKKDKEKGEYVTTVDSPDQSVFDIPTDETTISDNVVKFSAKSMFLSFKGEYSKRNDAITGSLMQGFNSKQIRLTRTPQEKKIVKRKQEPNDIPYISEEIKVKNRKDEIILAGTLTMPEDKEFSHAVILISGSGPQDRNSDMGIMNHRPFLVWADYLTRNGIAVIRYDERGVGGSTGDYSKVTSVGLSNDSEAIFEYVKSREDFKGVKVGFVGHSEGGMIAPMIAARNPEVDFVVLLAGPGVAVSELMLNQKYNFSKVGGLSDEDIEYDQMASKKVYAYIKAHPEQNEDEFYSGLSEIVKENVSDYPPSILGARTKEQMVDFELGVYTSPWFRYFIAYDPFLNLAQTECPLFALNGTLDLQVDNDMNLDGIKLAMEKGKNENYKLKSYEALNHLMQKAKTGAMAEYGQIEETVNEEVLTDVKDWILEL